MSYAALGFWGFLATTLVGVVAVPLRWPVPWLIATSLWFYAAPDAMRMVWLGGVFALAFGGASHALPFGFGDMPDQIAAKTDKPLLPLALTGGGPLTWRFIAARYCADHSAEAVLIVLDDVGVADRRWIAGRIADADVLGKIPADWQTVKVFASYATGFARINDQTWFQPDR